MSTKFTETKEAKEARQLNPQYLEAFESVDKTGGSDNDSVLGVYEGPIQKKTENKNSRVYTEEFWDNFFQDDSQQKRLEDGLMLGRVMHPDDGVDFDLNETSHVVTDVWDGSEFDEGNDDLIYGRVEVLDTESGRNLQAMLDAGVKLGISSRSAVYSEKDDGKEYITEGDIYGWDFVYDPSVEEAIPEQVERVEASGILLPFSESRESLISSIESNSTETAEVLCEAIDSESNNSDKSDSNKEESSMGEVNLEDVNLDDIEFEEAVESIPAVESEVNEMVEEIDKLEGEVEALEDEVEQRTERAKKAFERQREKYNDLMERAEKLGKHQEKQKDQLKEKARNHLEEAKRVYQNDMQEARDIYQNDLQEARKHYQEMKQKVEAFAGKLKDKHNEEVGRLESLLEDAKEEYQELKQESSSQAKSFYIDYILEDLNEANNDKLRGLLEDAESAEEIDQIVERIEEAQEALKDQLPIGGSEDEARKTAIEAVEKERKEKDDEAANEMAERVEGAAKHIVR